MPARLEVPETVEAPDIAGRHSRAAPRAVSRAGLAAAGAGGMLLAVALWLWVRHGSAVFHEMIVAGLALCF